MTEYGFNTMLLHGVKQNDPYGATHTPVYQSSAFRHESAEDLENIFTNKAMDFPTPGLIILPWRHLSRGSRSWSEV